MDKEKSYIVEDADEIFDTPDKLRKHIELLKKERDNLMSEVACLHRILLYIVRNTDACSGGTL